MKKESPFKFPEEWPKITPVSMDRMRGTTHLEITIPEDHVWGGKCDCKMCKTLSKKPLK